MVGAGFLFTVGIVLDGPGVGGSEARLVLLSCIKSLVGEDGGGV
jgi:hypothetical protein